KSDDARRHSVQPNVRNCLCRPCVRRRPVKSGPKIRVWKEGVNYKTCAKVVASAVDFCRWMRGRDLPHAMPQKGDFFSCAGFKSWIDGQSDPTVSGTPF